MTDTTPSPAPLRFALVPIEPTAEAIAEILFDPQEVYAVILAASPGNDLLQRIVRARDNLQSVRNCRGSEACDVMDAVGALADVLNELDGDMTCNSTPN